MGDHVLEIFGGRLYPVELALVIAVVLIVVGLTQYAKRSMTGIALLGMSENREAAQLRGVNVRRFALMAFVFTGVLAGFLGVFVGPKTYAVATLGASLALKGFVVLAIGGFGSMWGTLVGGLIVGLVEALTTRYVGADYAHISVFLILVVILMVKPTGLFTRRVERAV
ncbi:branched-chain amino acid ABC transporter permease [Microbacterium sp. NIBRBAC000506063]|uniref:branched-chain amino acid ABC transporter permease n=1 Tax=Microbacterium sp. NIBRBAC000506063 TaxID=2734618 RepID=UPI001BB69492|nr:branched-chain amino acid ABC transporter permease [Microbacterium sp. NIBRBAC000506063]QTV79064.1 branched-chain amino acid ABC transporter permease [Microbacterium sp. NIBRBAC000506063]